MTEQALRDTMVMLGASLFQRGYATGGAGNLSALLPDGTLIATMELPDPDMVPHMLAVSDVLVLAPHAGTVFLVARAEVTALGELQESAKRLGQAGVAVRSVIFNDLDMNRRRYGYGYGYGNA